MKTEAFDRLAAGALRILGRDLVQSEIESFGNYLSLLQKWQRIHRLVGSTEADWVVDNLFLDSLLFLRVLPSHVRSIADLGSGAGFPGIPIRIVRPDLEVTLIEARQRRVSFLSTAIRELGLTGVRVIGGRAEDADRGGLFDAVVIRCAGDVEDLAVDAARLLASGGVVAASGPPATRKLTRGDWVESEGVWPGSTRRFFVFRG